MGNATKFVGLATAASLFLSVIACSGCGGSSASGVIKSVTEACNTQKIYKWDQQAQKYETELKNAYTSSKDEKEKAAAMLALYHLYQTGKRTVGFTEKFNSMKEAFEKALEAAEKSKDEKLMARAYIAGTELYLYNMACSRIESEQKIGFEKVAELGEKAFIHGQKYSKKYFPAYSHYMFSIWGAGQAKLIDKTAVYKAYQQLDALAEAQLGDGKDIERDEIKYSIKYLEDYNSFRKELAERCKMAAVSAYGFDSAEEEKWKDKVEYWTKKARG